MLLQIREFIQRKQIVSNQQIAREFKLDLDTLQPMLELWLRKGVIANCQEKTPCQTRCLKCKVQPVVYYQYNSSKK